MAAAPSLNSAPPFSVAAFREFPVLLTTPFNVLPAPMMFDGGGDKTDDQSIPTATKCSTLPNAGTVCESPQNEAIGKVIPQPG